jgi:hypothetical protein
MSNTIKCQDCVYYDPQFKFTPKGLKEAWYGWCTKKSIYPHKTPDGQIIPEGVQRVSEDEPIAKPFIVDGSKILISCTDAVKK